jgi:excisionase family DNA binding protein
MTVTLNLEQAAAFLYLHIETVRRLAQGGVLPAAKPGKRWVFIQEDLAAWLRSNYTQNRQALLSDDRNKGGKLCHSTNVIKRGGLISPHQVESELSVLLKQR